MKDFQKNIPFVKILFCFIVCFLFSCCSHPKVTPVIFAGNAMTIDYRILIGEKLNSVQRETIMTVIQATFAEIDHIYNKWNPASEISQLNHLAAGEKKVLSPELFKFLTRIDYFVKLSQGKFDPTIEPMQQLWKKHLEQGELPPLVEIEALKNAIGWDKIVFTDGIFYKLDARTMLDFGGTAKGYCVDLLTERLQAIGFKNIFIEWGGEIRTSGIHPSNRPWSIFISKLGNTNPNEAIAQINLINQAIATSGDYYQQWTITLPQGEKKTYCHIFNPFSFAPLEVNQDSIASASLLAEDCLTADTLAKVLMLFKTKNEAIEWMNEIQELYPTMNFWIVTRN